MVPNPSSHRKFLAVCTKWDVFAGGVKVCLRYEGTPPPGGIDWRADARLDTGDLSISRRRHRKPYFARKLVVGCLLLLLHEPSARRGSRFCYAACAGKFGAGRNASKVFK